MLESTFSFASAKLLKVIQTTFDLAPDFVDKMIIRQIRDLAVELNEMADKEENKFNK